MKSAWLPLALVWIAAHALLLVLILSLKFLAAKTVLLAVMAGAAFWLVFGRTRRTPLLRSVP